MIVSRITTTVRATVAPSRMTNGISRPTASSDARGDPEARLLLGKAFIELGFKAKARHELTLILSEHPEHKEARVLLKRV